MSFTEISELCRAFAASHFEELELDSATLSVRLVKKAISPRQTLPVTATTQSARLLLPAAAPSPVIESPGIGSFLPFHPARRYDVYGQERTITAGETVGFIQIGFLLFPVISHSDGVIQEVLVKPGTTVDYGAALFKLRCQGAIE
ncbi:Biotin carboxyl carrier protein [Pseudomonas asplenii]|uniref:Biotin carboxyl carrier protein n=1 Tax=Pseudomonas asplenii TaxID=53407 RepID=A0A1H1X4K9_9PSED|nr:hypothetical protein [Pseudomonas asplenii]SDT04218.1 Biotin carboxyl carrier protein [Pseudomonas asplenii]